VNGRCNRALVNIYINCAKHEALTLVLVDTQGVSKLVTHQATELTASFRVHFWACVDEKPSSTFEH